MTRIGLIGTGFVARGIAWRVGLTDGMEISGVLTRRPLSSVGDFPESLLTDSDDKLIANSDIVIEASGDAIYATRVLLKAVEAELPIITMNPEFHVTTGSYFARHGYITEAEGDQPGCFAALDEEARIMGFKPLAYVNIKGFLNLDPPESDMIYWSDKMKVRIEQVTSFTDGSKLQIEQALVANGLGADIAEEGLIGGTVGPDLKDSGYLAQRARELGRPISDYVLAPGAPPGVMILCDHDIPAQFKDNIIFTKLLTSDESAYIVLKPFHLVILEVPKTIRAVMEGKPPLLNNSTEPTVGVAAITKKTLKAGMKIERALGSFEFRGSAVRFADRPDHVPVCLLANARLKRDLEPGQIVCFDDVELEESEAARICLDLAAGARAA